MSILNQLSSAQGRKDEVPNQELAAKIVAAANKEAVKELIENLNNKNKDIQNDCIKTLYEVAEKRPDLVSVYASDFIKLLDSKNSRMVWGTMTAISTITLEQPELVFNALPKIINMADTSGSVIARDHAMYILSRLATIKKYYEDCLILIIEQLIKAPVNQFPMYTEITAPVIKDLDKPAYLKILADRLDDIDQESKRKRIEKVLKKMS